MRILIIVMNFVPEIGSAAHIYYDLASAFVKIGHEVDVITSYPRDFYLGEKNQGKKFPLDENLNGITVHRHKARLNSRDNVVLRGLEHYLLPVSYFLRYKQLHKTFDVCLIYIPPLPLYYLGRAIKFFDNTPYVLNIQDFHPQELVDVGMLKNKLLIGLMEKIEQSSYKHADHITVMSSHGKNLIISRGGNSEKITHLYNSVNLNDYNINIINNDFKIEEKIESKFLISYAGIISPFQGIDDILDAANILKYDNTIVFYIVGDGMEKARIDKRVLDEQLMNVKSIPLQERARYLNILNSSDISIVTLDKRMTAPVLPGKFINILSLSSPVIANVPPGEVLQIVRNANCGIITEPGKPDQIAEAILILKNDPELRRKYGANGRRFVENNMNLEKNSEMYIDIFKTINTGN